MIVMKFGGTSNEDATAMENVIRIVGNHLDERPVVVISAISKATNELENAARVASSGDYEKAEAGIAGLFDRHRGIVSGLVKSKAAAVELNRILKVHLEEIKNLLRGLSLLGELTPRSMDAICSFGERLSSQIVAAGMKDRGINSTWVDAKDFMVTDANHGNARPHMESVTELLGQKVVPMVQRGEVPVTQGFIGVTTTGAYTTMGRESSDYSAAIIGAALKAERVQIWTDVDGILSADPRVVPETLRIKHLSFEEAFELSYFGAKVLHPHTMLPLVEQGIPVQVLNSKILASAGTLVDKSGAETRQPKSIAFKKDISLVTITPRQRLGQYLFWEGVFNVLIRYSLNIGTMTTSEYTITFSVERKLLSDEVVYDLSEVGNVELQNDKASICLVGKGLRGSAGIFHRALRALSEMNIWMGALGASQNNVVIVLENDQVQDALRLLHTEFFGHGKLPAVFDLPAKQ